MNKSYVLLRMYDELREGAGIRLTGWCAEYKLSVATFRRYIAFLRGYFIGTTGEEIIYDSVSGLYVLKNDKSEY